MTDDRPLFPPHDDIGPEEAASRMLSVLADRAGLPEATRFRTRGEWEEYLRVHGVQAHVNDEDDVQVYYIGEPCEPGEHPAEDGWLCLPED
jgi:thioesterase domain-containing protein